MSANYTSLAASRRRRNMPPAPKDCAAEKPRRRRRRAATASLTCAAAEVRVRCKAMRPIQNWNVPLYPTRLTRKNGASACN